MYRPSRCGCRACSSKPRLTVTEPQQPQPLNQPLTLRMHPQDNVAIVGNDGGLPAGTLLPEGLVGAGLVLREKVPQGHKLALVDIASGAPVLRYGVVIGYALRDIAAGSWVHERVLQLHGLIATGILRGLACQALKKKQLRSCGHSTSTRNAHLTARRAR